MSGGWLESFLVAFAMAVLKYYAAIAGKETKEYFDEVLELKKNKQKASDYDKVVQNPNASREERKNAEDSAFNN